MSDPTPPSPESLADAARAELSALKSKPEDAALAGALERSGWADIQPHILALETCRILAAAVRSQQAEIAERTKERNYHRGCLDRLEKFLGLKYASSETIAEAAEARVRELEGDAAWKEVSRRNAEILELRAQVAALTRKVERGEKVVEAAREACSALACTEYEDGNTHCNLRGAIAAYDAASQDDGRGA